MTRKQGFLSVCKKCNRLAKIAARNLCNTCYAKDVKNRNVRKCDKCGETRPHHSHGLCYRCNSNQRYHNARDEIVEQRKQKYAENIEKHREDDRARNKTQHRKEWQQEYNQQQYIANKEHLKEYQRKYKANHPGFSTHHTQKYKAKKAGLPHDLTDAQWKDILKQHNYTCYYCGVKNVQLDREHKIPVSRGGGYTISNIVPACHSCNMRKRNKTDVEFFEFLKKFPR